MEREPKHHRVRSLDETIVAEAHEVAVARRENETDKGGKGGDALEPEIRVRFAHEGECRAQGDAPAARGRAVEVIDEQRLCLPGLVRQDLTWYRRQDRVAERLDPVPK